MKSWVVASVALFLAGVMAFGTLASPRIARATPFLVNSTEDAVDAVPGDGICATLTGVCTLRAAIMEANMLPGTDTITIPAGIYKLTIPGSNEDRSATGDLDVSDAILVGAGSTRTIIDAGGLDRVFDAGGVQISGLTMQNGVAGNDGGGVIRGGSFTLIDVVVRGGTLPGGNTIATGAGIKASGSLTLVRTTVTGNSGGAEGGGLWTGTGPITIVDSTFSGNTTTGDSNVGGGIWISGPAQLRNVTISGNSADRGGGLFPSGENIELTNVTISNNRATGTSQAGAGIFHDNVVGATLRARNTIVADNFGGPNCFGHFGDPTPPVTSLGNNLDSDGSCGFTASGDLSNNPNAQLGALADNGGPTQTHALLAGSTAMDAGSNNGCPQADQRGIPRPQDGNGDGSAICDIGAYEFGGAASVATSTPAGTNTAVATATSTSTAVATSTSVPTATPTASPHSLLLNGSTAYAEAPHAPELAVNDWTFEAWFLDANMSFNHPRTRILSKGDISSSEVPLFASVESNSLIVGLRSGGTPRIASVSLAAVAPTGWHHLAATFQASTRTLTIYLDGAQQLQQVLASTSAGNTLPLIMGRSGTSGDYWRGKLDDIRLWNVVRTSADIQANYPIEITGSPAGLVGNWKFDEGTGTTAADSAATPQNAALQGGATWSTDVPQH